MRIHVSFAGRDRRIVGTLTGLAGFEIAFAIVLAVTLERSSNR